MLSMEEMQRRKNARAARANERSRGAERYFGVVGFNLAAEMHPVAPGAEFPRHQRPEGEVINQYGTQVGPVLLDDAGNIINVQLHHPQQVIPPNVAVHPEIPQVKVPRNEVPQGEAPQNIVPPVVDAGNQPNNVSHQEMPPEPRQSFTQQTGGLGNLDHLTIEPLEANTNLENQNLDLFGFDFPFESSHQVPPRASGSQVNAKVLIYDDEANSRGDEGSGKRKSGKASQKGLVLILDVSTQMK